MAERKKLLLRLDPQVYDAVARWATDDLRSVNAQIEYALRLALRTVGRPPKPSTAPGTSTELDTTTEPQTSDDPGTTSESATSTEPDG
ncbi:hypothetical protein OG792_28275 [Micromonospora sp. NBC_01699]|uniref:hypothetical protein n=1 Tax=Micromonospora sp. NBC_01699 TaxID=2975984 RepID=UPI002E2C6D38|nr:hypothetical protein [Micromonospora sp. NBC_01699]